MLWGSSEKIAPNVAGINRLVVLEFAPMLDQRMNRAGGRRIVAGAFFAGRGSEGQAEAFGATERVVGLHCRTLEGRQVDCRSKNARAETNTALSS